MSRGQNDKAKAQPNQEVGLILNVSSTLSWIWCKSYPKDIVANSRLVSHLHNPVGKWVSLGQIYNTADCYRIREEVEELDYEPVQTRVQLGVPELMVTCLSIEENEEDGSLVFWSEEIGEVADVNGLLKRYRDISLPFKVWVVKFKNRSDMYFRSRWKVSVINDFELLRRKQQREMENERNMQGTNYKNFDSHKDYDNHFREPRAHHDVTSNISYQDDHRRLLQRQDQPTAIDDVHDGLGENSRECVRTKHENITGDSVPSSSAMATSSAMKPLSDQKRILEGKSLAYLANALLENPVLSQKLMEVDSDLHRAFTNAVFNADEA